MKEEMKEAIDQVVNLLEYVSGVTKYQLRVAAYYVLTTYRLMYLQVCAILGLVGPTGVGKTALLEAMSKLVYKPVFLNFDTSTTATLRGDLAMAYEGTALIEECSDEQAAAESEAIMAGRFARNTAKVKKMAKKEADWQPVTYNTFGATIAHRRAPFADAALGNRVIWLPLHKNPERGADEYGKAEEWCPPSTDCAATVQTSALPWWSLCSFCA